MPVCPGPIHRLPFCVIPGVPPPRDAISDTPRASTNGPSGLADRPTDTEYPVVGPAQQFADDTNRQYEPSRWTTYEPSYLLSIATMVGVPTACSPSAESRTTDTPP